MQLAIKFPAIPDIQIAKKDMRDRYGSDSELRQKEQYRCMIIGARTRSLSAFVARIRHDPFGAQNGVGCNASHQSGDAAIRRLSYTLQLS